MMSVLLILALVPDIGMRMEHASRARLIFSAPEPAAELDQQLKGEGDAPAHSPEETEDAH
jgi:hypothetical protein